MSASAPSPEPILESRMLPRLSVSSLLALTTIAALIAAVARAAGQGTALASAAISALGFLAICWACFVLLFLLARLAAAAMRLGVAEPEPPTSPFAEDRLPPQLLPPREPPA